jgi:hypothetical protein
MLIDQLKQMFNEVTLAKKSEAIPKHYHPEFVMYTNEQRMTFEDFLDAHKEIYGKSIGYSIEYDETTFFESGNKVAGRMWITTSRPNEASTKIEVILIVHFKDSKIHRLWELTYPDWSALPAFNH